MKAYKKIFIYLLIVLCGFMFIGCTQENNGEDDKHETCVHEYVNGVCTKCNEPCPHLCFEDDVCTSCGMKLQDLCEHEFEDGLCQICGYRCRHEFEDGVCKICDYHCSHDRLKSGICMVCGIDYRTICEHTFNNGVCTHCTYKCPHEGVNCGDTCPVCGCVAEHRMVGGKCTVCGFEEKFTATEIPSLYLDTNCPEKGTVEKVVWQSWDYANERRYENTFFVYLPYGYNPKDDKVYNILYLLHGSGENSAYWLAQLGYKGGVTEKTKVLLDNMHYQHLCEDTIVVTPTSNLNGTANFYKELLNEIMPQAETRYKTYAHLYGKNVSEVKNSDFTSSRGHRAYAGLSRGSMIGWSVLGYELEYFGYFGFYSGGSFGLTQYYNASKATVASSKYDVLYAYHSCGNDGMHDNHVEEYNGLLKASNGRLKEGVNTIFLEKPNFGHTYGAWIIDLYNSLGYAFFKYTPNEE